MDKDDREWLDDAINQIVRASEKNILMLIVRRQDDNDGHDVALTNASDSPMVTALAMAANGYHEE